MSLRDIDPDLDTNPLTAMVGARIVNRITCDLVRDFAYAVDLNTSAAFEVRMANIKQELELSKWFLHDAELIEFAFDGCIDAPPLTPLASYCDIANRLRRGPLARRP